MEEAKVYNTQGKETGSVNLPENVFGLPWNADLVHQVVTSMQGNLRTPIAHTKNRGEVSGGGKKPWKQKGTGRARHGSIRSPIWIGGGIAHGPRNERSFKTAIPQKMRAKALCTVLSRKLKHGEVFFVDSLNLSEPKTKEAVSILKNLSKIPNAGSLQKKSNAVFISIPTYDVAIWKSFRNISSTHVSPVSNLNVLDVLQYKNLVIVNPEESIAFLAKKMSKTRKSIDTKDHSKTPRGGRGTKASTKAVKK